MSSPSMKTEPVSSKLAIIRAVWNEEHNKFEYFSSVRDSADLSQQQQVADEKDFPPEITQTVEDILGSGGIHRHSLKKLLVSGGTTFLLSIVGAFILNLIGQSLLAGLLFLSGPFLVFSMVCWWSLKKDRLNRVLNHLKKYEKRYDDRLKVCGRSFSALFVKGEDQEIEGYLEFAPKSQANHRRQLMIKIITNEHIDSTKAAEYKIDLDDSKFQIAKHYDTVSLQEERAETLQFPVNYEPAQRKTRIQSEYEPQTSNKRLIKIPTQQILPSSSRSDLKKSGSQMNSQQSLGVDFTRQDGAKSLNQMTLQADVPEIPIEIEPRKEA